MSWELENGGNSQYFDSVKDYAMHESHQKLLTLKFELPNWVCWENVSTEVNQKLGED